MNNSTINLQKKSNTYNAMKYSFSHILKAKKTLLYLTICLFCTQMQAQISLGGGLGYNEKISGPGITLKGVFNISDNIAISPSASYFFGNQVFGYNRSLFAGDINAHYYFNIIESKLKVYPVVGANFSSYKTGDAYYDIYFDYTTEEVSNSAFGGNIGAGATWSFSEKLKVYLEPKFVISDYSQIVINAGVLLNL